MTVVLAISSAVLALNGALDASPTESVGGSFAMEAVVGALESAPSDTLLLSLDPGSSAQNPYVQAIRAIFPLLNL